MPEKGIKIEIERIDTLARLVLYFMQEGRRSGVDENGIITCKFCNSGQDEVWTFHQEGETTLLSDILKILKSNDETSFREALLATVDIDDPAELELAPALELEVLIEIALDSSLGKISDWVTPEDVEAYHKRIEQQREITFGLIKQAGDDRDLRQLLTSAAGSGFLRF